MPDPVIYLLMALSWWWGRTDELLMVVRFISVTYPVGVLVAVQGQSPVMVLLLWEVANPHLVVRRSVGPPIVV